MMSQVSVLAENTARGLGILGEHGLSWWIDTGAHHVLFDTGQGMVFERNASRLGADLASADAIALSHGHADHVGGLERALTLAPEAALFMHPDATCRRYSGSDGKPLGRRLSTDFMEGGAFAAGARRVVASRESQEIVPGLWCTGEIPRLTDYEDTGGPFSLDERQTQPDPILDDMALFFRGTKGTVVVLGCAHAGVVNTLMHISKLTDGAPFHCVMGGMHLERASKRRIDATIDAFRDYDVRRIGPNHCTGQPATAAFWNAFPDRCFHCAAGVRLEL